MNFKAMGFMGIGGGKFRIEVPSVLFKDFGCERDSFNVAAPYSP